MQTITDKDIFTYPEFKNPEKYQKRITVKAIVQNKKNEFAFVTNNIHNHILLPGGGAESKDLEQEIDRECREEIFYSLKNVKELEKVREFRNRESKEYETTCYLAEINRKTTEDNRTIDERNNGLYVVWINKDEAFKKMTTQMEKLKKGKIKFYNTAFDIFRDYHFFKEYLKK